jgi:nucleoside-diphosphate-sugar epimerase
LNILEWSSKVNQSDRPGTSIKAVITGGTGFIGSHVVEEFLRRNVDVTCLLRPNRSSRSWLAGLPVHIEHLDLLDPEALKSRIADADYVVHVAGVTKAIHQAEFLRGNADTTRAILDALEGSKSLRSFCLVSSLAAVGPTPTAVPLDEAVPPRPITPYGVSKLAGEEICRSRSHRIPAVIIRPPAVYGPRDQDIFHLFRWVSFGIFPHTGPPNKELSVLHARDLARILYLATVDERCRGETFFVANPEPYRLRDIANTIAEIMGKKIIEVRIPRWTATVVSGLSQLAVQPFGKPAVLSFDKVRDLYALRWTCSPAKIDRLAGYRAVMSLEEGIRDTVDWYRVHRWL